MSETQVFSALGDAMRSILGQVKAAEMELIRNPTPEHAEYQRKAREAMHESIDDITTGIYCYDGNGVFDSETIHMLYNLAYALHDVVDGDAIGTLQAKYDAKLKQKNPVRNRRSIRSILTSYKPMPF